jgi:flagellar L-ring protein precursor FlgH
MHRFLTIIPVLLLALAAGCATQTAERTPMPVITPPPQVEQEYPENPGSLYTPSQAETLFPDKRARRVGDIVIINVVETSSGTHKADTMTEKENTVAVGVPNLFGIDVNNITGVPTALEATTETETDTTGETSRESTLTASVAARVVEKLPGGLLRVYGARQMRINDETQVMVIQGLIDSDDIGPSNSVSSDRLAEAQIDYYGQGVLADKQHSGWGTRLIDNLWPF